MGHQLDWTGLGSVTRGFGLDWIASTQSISYSDPAASGLTTLISATHDHLSGGGGFLLLSFEPLVVERRARWSSKDLKGTILKHAWNVLYNPRDIGAFKRTCGARGTYNAHVISLTKGSSETREAAIASSEREDSNQYFSVSLKGCVQRQSQVKGMHFRIIHRRLQTFNSSGPKFWLNAPK